MKIVFFGSFFAMEKGSLRMYLMIDNQDSFVYNLVAYLEEAGARVLVCKNDQITLDDCLLISDLEGIILSPGPGRPMKAGNCLSIFSGMKGKVPILGVCLGHQLIGECYGMKLEKGQKPMHGKISKLNHNREGLFANLPTPFDVTRYHSLVLCQSQDQSSIQIDGWTDDEVIMAISDRKKGVYGVQFHPESVMTQYGHEILLQFMEICKSWGMSE